MNLSAFSWCPLQARFIETPEHASSYYAHKMVGDHPVEVNGVSIVVRFNREEIHHFTDTRTPCPECDVVRRQGRSGERRCFCRDRARRLDTILETLRKATVVLEAKIPGGRLVMGPADKGAQRLGVVIAPEGSVWFVRTAYPVSAHDFTQARRSKRAAQWPPK